MFRDRVGGGRRLGKAISDHLAGAESDLVYTPQDVLYFVVWTGPFMRSLDLSYLPPAGFWNVWNMLLLRPIGVGVGALPGCAGLGDKRNWVTNMLIACGLLAIAAYVVMCGLILLSGLIGGR